MRNIKRIFLLLILIGSFLSGGCSAGSSATNPLSETLTPWSEMGFKNYAIDNFINGVIGAGVFQLPGLFGINLFSTWAGAYVFGDPNQEVLDKLNIMDEKLDLISNDLQVSLEISGDVLKNLEQFYNQQMQYNYQEALSKIQDDSDSITSKYKPYVVQEAFSSSYPANYWQQAYSYAQNNCNNDGVLEALDAQGASNNKHKNLQREGAEKVYDMFFNFQTTYIDEQFGAGEKFNQLKNSEADYVATLFNVLPNDGRDVMSYINYYNYQTLLYKAQLYNTYQKLYNMQFTQLAYRYACNAKIELLNLKLPSTGGITGFQDAIKILNQTYNDSYKVLSKNIDDSLIPISNQEIYQNVNNNFFSPAIPVLESSTFATTGSKAGECTISSLRFIPGQEGSGLAKLNSVCIVESDNTQIITESVAQDIPYSTFGDRIAHFPFYNIQYIPKLHYFAVTQNQNDPTKMTVDDLKVFTNNQLIESTNFVELNNPMGCMQGNEWDTCSWPSNYIYFANNFVLFPLRYNLKGDNAGWNTPNSEWGTIDNSSNTIFHTSPGSYYTDDSNSKLEQSNLISYNGHALLSKFIFIPELNDSYGEPDFYEHEYYAIDCLDKKCTHLTPNQINWGINDNIQITNNGSGSWLVAGNSTNVESSIKLYNFVKPSDYDQWLSGSNLELQKIYLDGREYFNVADIAPNSYQTLLRSPIKFISLQEIYYELDLSADGKLAVYKYSTRLEGLLGETDKELQYTLVNNVNHILMDGGNIEIYDKNDQITWSIQDLYYKQVQKWVSDPYAYLTLSDDGNTLSVIGSDKNHNFGNNGLIWSHANHKTSRNQ